MSVIRGVDGCKAGWLCLSEHSTHGSISAEVFVNAEMLLEEPTPAVTAMDIPIGLPNSLPRACDLEARELLGPRASSVFPAPVREALDARSYEAACSVSFRRCGKKLSQQTYAILQKIRDVDAKLQQTPSLLACVREVHPEVSFYFWNNRQPMRHPKSSGFGFLERLDLVSKVFDNEAEKIRVSFPRKEVADDDILDAFAALWTARRIHDRTAVCLGGRDALDDCRLPMQIHAWDAPSKRLSRRFLLVNCVETYIQWKGGEREEYEKLVGAKGGEDVAILEMTWGDRMKAEGRREGEAALLRRLLERRFGPLEAPQRSLLEKADAERLLEWGERVLTARSMDEVFEGD